jgi:hypothetical protein
MSGDIGRGAALLLAVLLGVFAPLSLAAGRADQNMRYALQEAVDEFTAKVDVKKAVTIADYEEMLADIARTGVVCSVDMYMGKRISREEGACLTTGRFVAGHVHTRNCYAGHNHRAEGCSYHSHSSECYCGGRMTKCYKTDYSSGTCYSCGGSGQTGTTETCSSCSGAGGSYKDIKCNCSNGMIYYPATCSSCGGSGVTSKGKTCKKCGGTGNMDAKKTHDYCGGTGYINTWVRCSNCKGSGTVSDVKTCSSCGGSGSRYSSVSYYCCSVCGKGSTTSYGGTCGRMTCTVAKEGWSCGIAAGDDHPLCGSIIVDAEYASGQTLEAGCCAADIDRTIVFTYLDGSRGHCDAELEGLAFDTPLAAGEHTADLVYTGYYMSAKNYEKRSFPVSITVEDAAGPQIIGIRAESLKDAYMPGENARIAVYAVYEDGEESIDPDDCWDTFDSNVTGEQLVYVGYEGHITSLLMYVKDDGSGAGNAPDEEEEIHITPAPAEDTGHGNNGSGADTGDPAGEDHGLESFSERTEEIIRASYEEMLGSEEILGLLTASGRIDLEDGDVFSITVTVESGKHGGFSGLFSRTKERKYTSGTVIG